MLQYGIASDCLILTPKLSLVIDDVNVLESGPSTYDGPLLLLLLLLLLWHRLMSGRLFLGMVVGAVSVSQHR